MRAAARTRKHPFPKVRGRSVPEGGVEEILDGLRKIFQAAEVYGRRAHRASGLTPPQAWALHVLAGEPRVSVGELARRMYLHPSTVVGIVHRLEAKGFLSRHKDPTDGRVVLLTLTAEGRSASERAPRVAQDYLVEGLSALAQDEREAVSRGIRTLVEILGASRFPAEPILSSIGDDRGRKT